MLTYVPTLVEALPPTEPPPARALEQLEVEATYLFYEGKLLRLLEYEEIVTGVLKVGSLESSMFQGLDSA